MPTMSTKWWCRRWWEWRGGDWHRTGHGCSTAERFGVSPASSWQVSDQQASRSNIRLLRMIPMKVRGRRLLQPSHGLFGCNSSSAGDSHPDLRLENDQVIKAARATQIWSSTIWSMWSLSSDHVDIIWPGASMSPPCLSRQQIRFSEASSFFLPLQKTKKLNLNYLISMLMNLQHIVIHIFQYYKSVC